MSRFTALGQATRAGPRIGTDDADRPFSIEDRMRAEPASPPASDLHRQGVPDSLPTADLTKKSFIDPAAFLRVQVVGVGDNEDHSADGANPFRLAEPDV